MHGQQNIKISYLVVVVVVVVVAVVVVVVVVMVMVVLMMMAVKMVKISHFQKKADLVCWQATDLYQYTIHIGNQLFILHTTKENLFFSFKFIVDKNYTIYWEFTINTFLLAQGAL